ncbi:MAG: GTP-binding protein [Candidatus Hodarchaeota archaeon]
MAEYDYLFKTIVLGDGGAGKTALTVRFSQGYFQESYKLTVGVDFSVKLIELQKPNGTSTKVKLQIWDTGGQERFSFVRPLYYRGAMGALLLFDVTNRESFDHLPNWIEELEANADPVPMVLVGNKIDLPRDVTAQEAIEFARQFNIKYYYETSAKTGEEVGDCFGGLAYEMIGLGLPDNQWPKVMRDLGLAPGSAPAPVAAQPAPAPVSVPQIQPVPSPGPAASPDFDFGMADEYGDYSEPSAPAPQPLPTPQPVPVAQPVPSVQPVPRSQPVPVAQPVPKPQPVPVAQPVPKVQPLPRVQSIPVAQPVPKPQPVPVAKPVPVAQPVKERPQAISLFQESSSAQPFDVTGESLPIEMPDIPVTPAPQPTTKRVAKPLSGAGAALPIPVKKEGPTLFSSGAAPAAEKPVPATTASSGPILFGQAISSTPASSTPVTDVPKNSPLFYLSQGLAAKGKAKAETKSSGFIPFSSGFTAAGSGGGASKPSAINIFMQTPAPVPGGKKEKKKKKKEMTTVICPGCGYVLPARFKFCNKCGMKIT